MSKKDVEKPKNKGGFTNPTLVAELRLRIAKYYCQGKSQWEIAQIEGLAQPTISVHLKKIREQWRERAIADFDQREHEELAKIDRLEEVSWAAWEFSCKPAESRIKKVETMPSLQEDEDGKKRRTKPVVGSKAAMVEIKRVVESKKTGQSGNPAFLDRIAWCIETRLRMLGRLVEKAAATTNVNVNTQVNWDSILRLGPPTAAQNPLTFVDPVEAEFSKLAASKPTSNGNGNGKH